MGLYQLVYQSQSLVPFEMPELTGLLVQSRDYNRLHDVTGLLLYTPDGRFLQVLEGEQAAVRDLFRGRIVHDPRHFNCRVLSEGPCLRRSFANWHMGFRPAGAGHLRTLLGYVSLNGAALLVPRPPTRPELVALLEEFVAGCAVEPSLEDPWG